MMSPEDRAVLIARDIVGKDVSPPMFRMLLRDEGERGDLARKVVAAIKIGIERDRADIARECHESGYHPKVTS